MSEIAYTRAQRSANDAHTANREHSRTRKAATRWIRRTTGSSRDASRCDQHDVLEKRIMSVRNAANDVMAAVAVMEHARDACANLSPLDLPMTPAQLEHRARMIVAVLNASRKLQQLRDRAVSLEGALARFRARKAELAA
jgi:hypothetical protein